MRQPSPALAFASVLTLAACGGDGDSSGTPDANPDTPDAMDQPDAGEPAASYDFESRFEAGVSSVAYDGQALRQVLIADLARRIGGLTNRINTGDFPTDLLAELSFYYDFDGSIGGEVALDIATTPEPLQGTYGAMGNARLSNKIAGVDPSGADAYKDFSVGGTMVGWGSPADLTPHQLVQHWFDLLDAQADLFIAGTPPSGPDGQPLTLVHVTPDGLDLQQLTQKFLLGAVNYSQVADDYLDEGLLVDNTAAVEGKPYTQLEHFWDEGFGYLGAARHYGDFTDEEAGGKGGREAFARGYNDRDGDGKIDLKAELNYGGAATNAARRDLTASTGSAPTDFSGALFDNFVAGRALITAAGGALGDDQRAALEAHRDAAILAWEQALAASCVHYINQVLVDMGKIGTAGYSFADHAKHWSELKGFSLGLQFNPRKQISDAQFVTLQQKLGDKPVLENATTEQRAAYAAALIEARTLLGEVYGFAAANLGDADGQGGW
jgi:hypothetical protein